MQGDGGTCGDASNGLQVGQEVEGVHLDIVAEEHIDGQHAGGDQVAQAQLSQVPLQHTSQPVCFTGAASMIRDSFFSKHYTMAKQTSQGRDPRMCEIHSHSDCKHALT